MNSPTNGPLELAMVSNAFTSFLSVTTSGAKKPGKTGRLESGMATTWNDKNTSEDQCVRKPM